MNYTNLNDKFTEVSSSLSSIFEADKSLIALYLLTAFTLSLVTFVILSIVVGILIDVIQSIRKKNFENISLEAETIIGGSIVVLALAAGSLFSVGVTTDIVKSFPSFPSIIRNYAIKNIETKYDSNLLSDIKFSYEKQDNETFKYYVNAEYINDETNTNAQMKIRFASDGEPFIMKSELITDDLIKNLENKK